MKQENVNKIDNNVMSENCDVTALFQFMVNLE